MQVEGSKMLKTYPSVCVTQDGQRFVQEIEANEEEYETLCLVNEGTWVAEYNECEYISQETCEESGGEYFECGSACRHETTPGPCTLNCVLYCAF